MASLTQQDTLTSYGFSKLYAASLPNLHAQKLIAQLFHLAANLYHGKSPQLAFDLREVIQLQGEAEATRTLFCLKGIV
jgi:hypothetical protein